jgi:hypothetical protein
MSARHFSHERCFWSPVAAVRIRLAQEPGRTSLPFQLECTLLHTQQHPNHCFCGSSQGCNFPFFRNHALEATTLLKALLLESHKQEIVPLALKLRNCRVELFYFIVKTDPNPMSRAGKSTLFASVLSQTPSRFGVLHQMAPSGTS